LFAMENEEKSDLKSLIEKKMCSPLLVEKNMKFKCQLAVESYNMTLDSMLNSPRKIMGYSEKSFEGHTFLGTKSPTVFPYSGTNTDHISGPVEPTVPFWKSMAMIAVIAKRPLANSA